MKRLNVLISRNSLIKIIFVLALLIATIITAYFSYANNTVQLSIVYKNKLEVALSKYRSSMDTTNFKEDVYQELENMGINRNLVTFHDIERQEVNSNATDAATIFNTWGRVGWTGQWSYNQNEGTVINAQNTDNYTGFYDPNCFEYSDITMLYDNTTTDSDDDVMGAMVRFNVNPNGTVTTYVFALDRHDYNSGIGNGQYNGLLKITNNSFAAGSVQLLQHTNAVWTRNKWTTYRIEVKANNIKVYQQVAGQAEQLLIDYTDTDNPIYSGTYGFFSYSQAYSKYKNIHVETEKYESFDDALLNVTFDETNFHAIVNITDEEEPALTVPELRASILSRSLNEDIHYIGLGTDDNKEQIEEFIAQNDDKGTYIDNTNYANAVHKTAEYIRDLLRRI